MLLLVMIVFCVLGFTIAIVPVSAVAVHEHRAQSRAASAAARPDADPRVPTVAAIGVEDQGYVMARVS